MTESRSRLPRSNTSRLIDLRERTVVVDGVRIAFLEAGDGPVVMLLHGFPDNAWSWEHQIPALVEAGYRVVAPFMRGYAPSEVPVDGQYDPTTLGRDLIGLAAVVNGGEPVFAVGHDIGAIQLQAALGETPSMFRRPVMISVNHAATIPSVALTPDLAHRSFHIWLLASALNVRVARHDDMALVDYLWKLWSPPGTDNHRHIARVKDTLSSPGSLRAAVSIYPHLLHGPTEAMVRTVECPLLLIYGADDVLPPALTPGEEHHHPGGLHRAPIAGSVHWPHRERPDEVNATLLDWLGTPDAPLAASEAR